MRSMENPTFSAPAAETPPEQTELNPGETPETNSPDHESHLSTQEFLEGQHARIKDALRDIHTASGQEVSELDLEAAATSLLLEAGMAAVFANLSEKQPELPSDHKSHDTAVSISEEMAPAPVETFLAKSTEARQRRRARREQVRTSSNRPGAARHRAQLQRDDRLFEAELGAMVNYQWDPSTALTQTKAGTRRHY